MYQMQLVVSVLSFVLSGSDGADPDTTRRVDGGCGESNLTVFVDDTCASLSPISRYNQTVGSTITFRCKNRISLIRSIRQGYCPVQVCQENKTWTHPSISCKELECHEPGKHYFGTRNCSKSGLPCQPWIKRARDLYDDTSFPDDTMADAKTYCRDPGLIKGAPWCFIGNGDKWEFCDVPQCRDVPVNDTSCRPTTQLSEVDCGLPDFRIRADNKCVSIASLKPFDTIEGSTMDFSCKALQEGVTPRINYCPVEVCQSDGIWRQAYISCAASECYRKDKSQNYKGRRICTSSGTYCIPWMETELANGDTLIFADGSAAAAGSYCRDPGGVKGSPWCYTSPTTWELCGVQNCEDVPTERPSCIDNVEKTSSTTSTNTKSMTTKSTTINMKNSWATTNSDTTKLKGQASKTTLNTKYQGSTAHSSVLYWDNQSIGMTTFDMQTNSILEDQFITDLSSPRVSKTTISEDNRENLSNDISDTKVTPSIASLEPEKPISADLTAITLPPSSVVADNSATISTGFPDTAVLSTNGVSDKKGMVSTGVHDSRVPTNTVIPNSKISSKTSIPNSGVSSSTFIPDTEKLVSADLLSTAGPTSSAAVSVQDIHGKTNVQVFTIIPSDIDESTVSSKHSDSNIDKSTEPPSHSINTLARKKDTTKYGQIFDPSTAMKTMVTNGYESNTSANEKSGNTRKTTMAVNYNTNLPDSHDSSINSLGNEVPFEKDSVKAGASVPSVTEGKSEGKSDSTVTPSSRNDVGYPDSPGGSRLYTKDRTSEFKDGSDVTKSQNELQSHKIFEATYKTADPHGISSQSIGPNLSSTSKNQSKENQMVTTNEHAVESTVDADNLSKISSDSPSEIIQLPSRTSTTPKYDSNTMSATTLAEDNIYSPGLSKESVNNIHDIVKDQAGQSSSVDDNDSTETVTQMESSSTNNQDNHLSTALIKDAEHLSSNQITGEYDLNMGGNSLKTNQHLTLPNEESTDGKLFSSGTSRDYSNTLMSTTDILSESDTNDSTGTGVIDNGKSAVSNEINLASSSTSKYLVDGLLSSDDKIIKSTKNINPFTNSLQKDSDIFTKIMTPNYVITSDFIGNPSLITDSNSDKATPTRFGTILTSDDKEDRENTLDVIETNDFRGTSTTDTANLHPSNTPKSLTTTASVLHKSQYPSIDSDHEITSTSNDPSEKGPHKIYTTPLISHAQNLKPGTSTVDASVLGTAERLLKSTIDSSFSYELNTAPSVTIYHSKFSSTEENPKSVSVTENVYSIPAVTKANEFLGGFGQATSYHLDKKPGHEISRVTQNEDGITKPNLLITDPDHKLVSTLAGNVIGNNREEMSNTHLQSEELTNENAYNNSTEGNIGSQNKNTRPVSDFKGATEQYDTNSNTKHPVETSKKIFEQSAQFERVFDKSDLYWTKTSKQNTVLDCARMCKKDLDCKLFAFREGECKLYGITGDAVNLSKDLVCESDNYCYKRF